MIKSQIVALGALGLFGSGIGCGRERSIEDATALQSHLEVRTGGEKPGRHRSHSGAQYIADCNDPDSFDPTCVHPSAERLAVARANGYPYYVGHAEPAIKFFSNAPNSASNMRWKLRMPTTDPSPTQNGSSTANFELFIATWIGLVVCDPNSFPYGGCTAASDSNNPATAGSAFMELQFYPPGAPGQSCSTTQWCARIAIWSWHDNSPFVSMHCQEPGSLAYVTTNGFPSGQPLLLSNGDDILVTLHDTVNGLQIDINDFTSGATGLMVASAANGFVHNTALIANGVCSVSTGTQCTQDSNCPSGQTCVCQQEPFNYHAMYATATSDHGLGWAWGPNVSFSYEIGHWDLCGDTACNVKPPGGTACTTVRGVGGCYNADDDHSGSSYQAVWPDGNAAHPSSMVIGAGNDFGIGPLSASATNTSNYSSGYNTINFLRNDGTSGAFFPFYSAAGSANACRFNFGNDIPGVTTNDFSKTAQYGTSMFNPCYPGPAAELIGAAIATLR